MAPHMHWFMALFSVPLMMILGTDAFYYALLPIIIGVVAPVYVGLGLADVSIGDHIKYALKFVWPMSILVLIGATILGVVPF